MKGRRLASLASVLGLVTFAASAHAQQSPAPDDDTAPITLEDIQRPRQGHTEVRFESTRGGSFALGIAPDVLTQPERGVRFANQRVPVYCTQLPCTLYLPPGTRRIVGDAATDFSWATSLTVPDSGPIRVRLRGQLLGFSALGGIMFVTGLAGTVGGPAVVIIYGVAQSTRFPPEVLVGGSIALGTGLALFLGGFALVNFASPRIDGISTVSIAPLVGPNLAGLSLSASF